MKRRRRVIVLVVAVVGFWVIGLLRMDPAPRTALYPAKGGVEGAFDRGIDTTGRSGRMARGIRSPIDLKAEVLIVHALG